MGVLHTADLLGVPLTNTGPIVTLLKSSYVAVDIISSCFSHHTNSRTEYVSFLTQGVLALGVLSVLPL